MNLPNGMFEQHGTYLNTATFGLPPKPAVDAMVAALEAWRTGRTSEEDWEADTERARASFARLTHVPAERVAVGATVSELLGLVAASLPDGARVLTAANDFSSTLFPFAAHQHRGVTVDAVPLEDLPESLARGYAAVVVSHVQAQSGAVADLAALKRAAQASGTMLCVDGTQACGWLETDARHLDVYVCHAYKWLLSPRGAAFLVLRPEHLQSIVPLHAGWYATDDPNNNLFGLPSRVSSTARRFDTSPAWFSWVGTARALAIVEKIGIASIGEHDMNLARVFCEALNLPAPDSPIVYVDTRADLATLLRAGIRASVRAGRLRLSFHLYNTQDDVVRALAAIR